MALKCNIIVGMSLHPDASRRLAEAGEIIPWPWASAVAQQEALATADAALMYSPSFDPAFLAGSNRLKVISCHACPDTLLLEAQARGIQITHVPSLWDTVADHTLALLFAAARNTSQADAAIRAGEWNRQTDLKVRFSGHDIHGKTLGILGLGRIGVSLARRLQGFNMRLLYSDLSPKPELEKSLGLTFCLMDDLLSESDIVAVLLPLNGSTRGILGEPQLRRLKSDAILVNTARGALFDEQALVRALAERRICAAGLDVYLDEPLEPAHPFLKTDNLVLSPHLGGSTKECDMTLVDDAIRVLNKEPPRFPLSRG